MSKHDNVVIIVPGQGEMTVPFASLVGAHNTIRCVHFKDNQNLSKLVYDHTGQLAFVGCHMEGMTLPKATHSITLRQSRIQGLVAPSKADNVSIKIDQCNGSVSTRTTGFVDYTVIHSQVELTSKGTTVAGSFKYSNIALNLPKGSKLRGQFLQSSSPFQWDVEDIELAGVTLSGCSQTLIDQFDHRFVVKETQLRIDIHYTHVEEIRSIRQDNDNYSTPFLLSAYNPSIPPSDPTNYVGLIPMTAQYVEDGEPTGGGSNEVFVYAGNMGSVGCRHLLIKDWKRAIKIINKVGPDLDDITTASADSRAVKDLLGMLDEDRVMYAQIYGKNIVKLLNTFAKQCKGIDDMNNRGI